MVSNDKKRIHEDLRTRLTHFKMDHNDIEEWVKRDGINIRPLPAGLEGITHPGGYTRPYNRWGVTDSDLEGMNTCRFCGSKMYIIKETNDGIVMGCPLETCPNYHDSEFSKKCEERARKRVSSGGTIREDVFGEDPPWIVRFPDFNPSKPNALEEAEMEYRRLLRSKGGVMHI